MVVHHTPLPKIPGLSLHFMYHLQFLLVQHHRSILSTRIFWKRNLKPLTTSRSFPFSLRITLATFTGSIFTPAAWDTTGTAEN